MTITPGAPIPHSSDLTHLSLPGSAAGFTLPFVLARNPIAGLPPGILRRSTPRERIAEALALTLAVAVSSGIWWVLTYSIWKAMFPVV